MGKEGAEVVRDGGRGSAGEGGWKRPESGECGVGGSDIRTDMRGEREEVSGGPTSVPTCEGRRGGTTGRDGEQVENRRGAG